MSNIKWSNYFNSLKKKYRNNLTKVTFEIDEDHVRIVKELRRTQKSVSSKSQKRENTPHVDDYFMPRITPEAQPSLKSVLQNKQIV